MWLSPDYINLFLLLKIVKSQLGHIHWLFWNVWIDISMVIIDIFSAELLFFLFKFHLYLFAVIINLLYFLIGFIDLFYLFIYYTFLAIVKDRRLWDKNIFIIFLLILWFLNWWFFWKLLLIVVFLFNNYIIFIDVGTILILQLRCIFFRIFQHFLWTWFLVIYEAWLIFDYFFSIFLCETASISA